MASGPGWKWPSPLPEKIHLMMTPLHQFGKADVEFGDVTFLSLQDELVAPRHHFQVGKIRAELAEYFVANPEDFDGVDGVQRDGFLHKCANILLLFGLILEKSVILQIKEDYV